MVEWLSPDAKVMFSNGLFCPTNRLRSRDTVSREELQTSSFKKSDLSVMLLCMPDK